MPPSQKTSVFDVSGPAYDCQEVIEELAKNGVAVLRGLFKTDAVREADEAGIRLSRRPAIAGTVGYAKVDHPKRVLPSFILGKKSTQLVLHEDILDVIESYLGGETILSETFYKLDSPTGYVYFDLHSDLAPGLKKSQGAEIEVTEEDMKIPLSVGTILYLHDTTEGAFGYSHGTHLLGSKYGTKVDDYPIDIAHNIREAFSPISGKRGDVVVFDKRGFHGPDQPSRSERRAILSVFLKTAHFGRVQVTPIPVWTDSLSGISNRQLRTLGTDADHFWETPESYTMTRFKKKRMLYNTLAGVIERAYLIEHYKKSARQWLRAKFIRKHSAQ